MYEVKRVFGNRKLLITLVIFFVLNAVLFYRDRVAPYQNQEIYAENYLKEKTDSYNRQLKNCNGKTPEQIQEETEQRIAALQVTSGKQSGELAAYYAMFEQNAYIIAYQNKYKQIAENTEQLLESTALSEKGGFSERNIRKTERDFVFSEGLQLTLANEQAIQELCSYSVTDYFLLGFMAVLVLVIYEERKKGLWEYVFVTKSGRKSLAILRVGILLLGSLFITGLLYLQDILLSGYYFGGLGDLDRAAQSNPIFENVTISVSMRSCLLLIMLCKVLAAAVFGMLLWLLISNAKHITITFLVFGAVIFGEYAAYTQIGAYSPLKFLKYVNLFSCLNSQEQIGAYLNLNLFGYAVGSFALMCSVFFCLLVALAVLMIWTGKRRPFAIRESRMLQKLLGQITRGRHCSMVLHELYKLFVCQKLWIAAVLFLFCTYEMTKPQQVYFDYANTLYNQYMEKLSGDVTEEKASYLQNELQLWQGKLEQCKAELEAHYNRKHVLSDRQLKALEDKIENLEIGYNVTEELIETAEQLAAKKAAGYTVSFVNNTAYEMCMGTDGVKEAGKDTLLLLGFMILIVAPLWPYDTQSGMQPAIWTMKNGRKKQSRVKKGIALGWAFISTTVIGMSRLLKIHAEYRFTSLGTDVQSLVMFRDFSWQISIGSMLMLLYLVRVLIAMLMAMLVLYLSKRTPNCAISIVISSIVLLVPACLVFAAFYI